ncbi:hypothetical protein A9P82_05545 [Arachidicoccus ginsenosidimutans]|uniref:type IX secretion system periplasmic lipoprotein PorW/SprE n=1 Tax=Arachidicoccus sp. BS20 TaxID=1850526 RepID=UPI0007F13B10|nr:hypothetical protein [Arachidicoccus sp. BS20]ANI88797.1 hypothetical protein A9P82_05545 [Arachidicoccus sp. BS20]
MKRRFFLFILECCICAIPAFSQVGTTISLKGNKPPEYANKPLPAERTPYGKIGKAKKFIQNTFVHYNFLFNANRIFNDIMQQAVASNVDDYARLLRFYPYDEKALAADKRFDSVIQHATAGLLLHDLRNDYVDELYFITGKSYFFEKKYDSSQYTFQYLNYAFAPKDDGYDIPIGSNSSSADKRFSISNKEKSGIGKNNLKNINRRNDALVWLARNFIEQKNYVQAQILLNNLSRDVHFPERLQPLLNETKAYYFYQQNIYDSAAYYLSRSHFNDDSKTLKARRHYLTAQLYQLSGADSAALHFYEAAKKYSTDPQLDIYAEKNIAALNNRSDANDLNTLLRKNKYFLYKDLIYYQQAEIARANHDDKKAIDLLQQSVIANRSIQPQNGQQRSKTFFLLANTEYDNNLFASASAHYDSVSANFITDSIDKHTLQHRSHPLHLFAVNADSMHVQDSLLTLANMPEKDRTAILKQAARRIRKSIDKREDEAENNSPLANRLIQRQQQTTPTTSDLFSQGASAAAWYFNNQPLKSSGYQRFKQKFGNRPNVDNWQRLSAISGTANIRNTPQTAEDIPDAFNADSTLKLDSSEITAQDLLAGLPMTSAQKANANNIISQAILDNGKILQNSLENFRGAIFVYDSLLQTFPKSRQVPEALYNIFVCYTLLGDSANALQVKNNLLNNYPSDSWSKKLFAKQNRFAVSATSLADSATKTYNDIYNLFLSGKFEEAVQQKNIADKKYGSFYWTPQLLYIEAIYHVSKNEDSTAIGKLNYLIKTFASSPMLPQAKTMIDVLKHRKEIEAYLRSLHISPEDYLQNNILARLEEASQKMNQPERRVALYRDGNLVDMPEEKISTNSPTQLNAPDKTFAIQNAATDTAQQQTQSNQQQTANNNIVTTQDNAIEKPDSDKIAVNINVPNTPPTDSAKTLKPAQSKDSAIVKPQKVTVNPPVNNTTRVVDGFTFNNNAPQYVTIVLDNVAPVYATEAGNAFNRYNLLTFPNKQYNVNSQQIGDETLILIGPFKNNAEAQDYQSKIQPHASNEIIPWITTGYSFIKISPENLNKLHTKADVEKYKSAESKAEN